MSTFSIGQDQICHPKLFQPPSAIVERASITCMCSATLPNVLCPRVVFAYPQLRTVMSFMTKPFRGFSALCLLLPSIRTHLSTNDCLFSSSSWRIVPSTVNPCKNIVVLGAPQFKASQQRNEGLRKCTKVSTYASSRFQITVLLTQQPFVLFMHVFCSMSERN